jgi:hypothetical protein
MKKTAKPKVKKEKYDYLFKVVVLGIRCFLQNPLICARRREGRKDEYHPPIRQ